MKIGIYLGKYIFADAKSGGVFTFQQSILNSLVELNDQHDLYIFSDDANRFPKNSKLNFVQLNRFYANENESFFKTQILRIYRKIKRNRLEKNYFSALNKAVLEKNIELMWFVTPAYEFVEVPYVYTVWDLQHRKQSFFPEVSIAGWKFEDREKRYNLAIPRAAYVAIGNESGKDEIVKFYGIPPERVKTIPMPTPNFVFNKFEIDSNLEKKLPEKFLFYPAQFWPHKNHIVILYALNILKEKHGLDFSVVFTGSDKGNLKYIKQKVKELDLQDKVYFLGFVSIQKLITLYKNAFALVFASFFGPDNIPPLEAFALKCSVIAAKVDGSQYQLKDAALLFNPTNENELADCVKNLLDDKELKEKLIENGVKKANVFSSKNYIKQIFNIFDEFALIRRCWSNTEKY
ncbi:glycosyltransferase family 4 protein, partial [Candidatus Babeliales bacterium]|nr:glycosyltransferase family 4 protein [Candidatus Babeliales bacterium]